MSKQQKPQVVYVKQRNGLLHFVVFTWLFGLFYWAWLGLKLCWRLLTWPIRAGTRVGWKTLVEWPWNVTVAAGRWTVRGVQALIANVSSRGD